MERAGARILLAERWKCGTSNGMELSDFSSVIKRRGISESYQARKRGVGGMLERPSMFDQLYAVSAAQK